PGTEWIGAADIEQLCIRHRTGLELAFETSQLPELLPRRRIIRSHAVSTTNHQLGPLLVVPDERRAPGSLFRALDAPQLLAVLFVQGYQERLLFVIALHEESIAIQRRRAGGAKSHGGRE